MKQLMSFAALLLLATPGLIAGCSDCGHTFPIYWTTYDIKTSGELVAPASLGDFPTMVQSKGPACTGSNGLCLEKGPADPGCDTICIALDTDGPQPQPDGIPRGLSLTVRIPGPPPKVKLTLPHPGVEAMFTMDGPGVHEEFPVTGGSVTPHLKKGAFVIDVEATATTPAGDTIAVHDGHYALVNLRTEMACQQD